MAEEAANSSIVVTKTEQNENSAEGTIQGGGAESASNTNSNAESSAVPSDGDMEKSLEFADHLMDKGSKASKDQDFGEAAECYSRALEIRVAHFGELAPQCVNTYYKYGCALLYKAQDESDPLVSVPKKEEASEQDSKKDESAVNVTNGESSVSSTAQQSGTSVNQEKAPDGEKSKEEEESDDTDDEGGDDDVAEADEDESDLDLSWKMLDLARAIVEKQSGDTMEKVDILSALAEVALEREDVETSLSDYLKALEMLERLVEPDSRFIAELNFRICLCLEIGSKPQDGIPYCQKAISICKLRKQRLSDEIKKFSESTTSSEASEADKGLQRSLSSSCGPGDSVAKKEAEIETLTGLASEIEKKLEDLQQLVSNPSSILAEILDLVSAKARGANKSDATCAPGSSQMGTVNSSGDVDSPTVSTAHTNAAAAVTHLGVVGRGVKRVNLNSLTQEPADKKPALDPSPNSGDVGAP